MVTEQMIQVYVAQLCNEIGWTPESIYDAKNNSWIFSRGSASIEVFMTSYQTAVKTVRTFLRCFSAILPLPADSQKRSQLFQEALENNSKFMGVKLAVIPEKGYLYAVAERDIDGMDYEEFKSMISDLGYWADQLDDILQTRFGSNPSLN
ncbi:MAG: YbjN domain-containing protein [Chitinophagaceae bacterium]